MIKWRPLVFSHSFSRLSLRVLFWILVSIYSSFASQGNLIVFKHNESLSQLTITCMESDRDGFLWIGTHDGLNRYDGKGIHTFIRESGDPTSLTSDNVRDLMLDKSGKLWVVMDFALNKYNPDTESFTRFFSKIGSNNQAPNFLCALPDDQNQIWVGSTQGLFLLDNVNQTVNPTGILEMETVNFLEPKTDEEIWIGTNLALYYFNTGSRKIVQVPFTKGYSFLCLLNTRENTLLAGTEDGLLVFPKLGNQPQAFKNAADDPDSLSDNQVNAIIQNSNGQIWIGTNTGLNLFEPEEMNFKKFFSSLHFKGLPNNEITCFHQSQPGLSWIGTHQGLSAFDDMSKKFDTFRITDLDGNPLVKNYIRGFCEDSKGMIWIGAKEGLAVWNRSKSEFHLIQHDQNVPDSYPKGSCWSILEDSSQQLWMATNFGLARLLQDSERFEMFKNDPLDETSISSGSLYCLAELTPGKLLVGTRDNGLSLMDTQKQTFKRFKVDADDPRCISDPYIRCILKDSIGRVWVGTHRGVLHLMQEDGNSFRRFFLESNLKEDPTKGTLFCMAEDSDQTLWLGRGEGLQKVSFDGTNLSFKHFTTKSGLPNNSIYGIVIDDKGFIWLSSNRGISKFDPIEEAFQNFSLEDGLQANEFNVNSYYKLKSGELLFGGVAGFNVIDPDNLKTNPFLPQVVFTHFQINNQVVWLNEANEPIFTKSTGSRVVRNGQTIELDYEHRVISLEFAALNFAAPESNRYAYKLEGFDSDWVQPQGRDSVTYTNLAPGLYEFQVRASNNDNVWNPVPAKLNLYVRPPFWQTGWFRLIGVLLFSGVLLTGHRVRTSILRRHNLELMNEIQSRKLTEEQLKRSEEKFSRAFNSIPDGILLLGIESGKILEANPGFSAISQLERKDLIDKSMFQLNLWPKENQNMDLSDKIKSGLRIKNWRGTMVTNEGNHKTIQLLAEPIYFESTPCLLVIVRDLTETHRLEAQLNHSQKMDSIGQLAGGIAHDFNNLLTVINGYSELGMRMKVEDPKVSKIMQDIQSAGQKAQRLTSQILAFSRKQIFQPVPLEINSELKEMTELFRRLLDENITLELKLCPKPISILADPSQIEQIIMNLLVNARDAIHLARGNEKTGVISLSTEQSYFDPSDHSLELELKGGWYLILSINDNGCGMPEAIHSKVFEPFFTTKKMGSGTGLGLSTVYGIVRQNNGTIHIYSEEQEGTRISVYWPISDESGTSVPVPESHSHTIGGTETILLVEDNAQVLEYLACALAELGYILKTATNGLEAIEIVQSGFSPDLIITDLVMPQMNGAEMARELSKTFCQNTPILFLSGYSNTHLTDTGALSQEIEFLQKPFSFGILAQKIRDVLFRKRKET